MPIRGRKHKAWSHGGALAMSLFPRKLPAPCPYHGTFRRAPVALASHGDRYGRNFFPSPMLPRASLPSKEFLHLPPTAQTFLHPKPYSR